MHSRLAFNRKSNEIVYIYVKFNMMIVLYFLRNFFITHTYYSEEQYIVRFFSLYLLIKKLYMLYYMQIRCRKVCGPSCVWEKLPGGRVPRFLELTSHLTLIELKQMSGCDLNVLEKKGKTALPY